MASASEQPDWHDEFLTAALEPHKWPDVLHRMASHCGSARGQLIGIGGARDVPFNIVTHIEASQLQEFIDIGGASPAINFRVAASNQAAAQGNYDGVLFEQHYDAAMPLLESDRYLRWCDEMDIPHGCQTNLVVDRLGLVGLATLRTRKDGRTTARQRKVFAEAAGAARRAVRLQERLEGEQAKLLAGAFDSIAATAFVLDGRGHVRAMTESAERIVASGDIQLRDRQLDAPGTPMPLAQAVAGLINDDKLQHVRVRIDCRGPRPRHFLEGFRLPPRAWSLGHLPHAILLIRSPQRDRAGIASFLTALYRLSPAEADIALRLFEGKNRVRICQERRVSSETLRGQIKSIHAKTGAANEADLMRLMAAIMA